MSKLRGRPRDLCRDTGPVADNEELGETDEHLRAIRETLPDTSERLSHGAPSFFYREKRCFLMFMDNHHDDGRRAIWCAAPEGMQELLVGTDPGKFFRPPYVGHRGWLGVMLHGKVDWDEIAGIVEDAYATVAA